jgi:IclR family acetate operon transcriptional repressor
MRLADLTTKRIGTWANPHLADAVGQVHESVNLAILDGDEVVYVAQVQPDRNFMRMFTEVGRRTLPHATAVGKAMLASRDESEVRSLLDRTGMPRYTEHTLTSPAEFLDALARARELGYAMDEGEQEVGVRCVAVEVPGAPQPMALSMSGPTTRMTDDTVRDAVPVLRRAAERVAAELSSNGATRI